MNSYWIVGVSGGVDSMVLLHQLHQKRRRIVAVHVNYQKRATAFRDQEIVECFCDMHQIPLVVFDGSDLGEGNFQDLARAFRYDAFYQVYQAYRACRLVLAHHLDDHYETILFQLLSQRTPVYLGMKRFTKIKGMLVYRPLLSTPKEELEVYSKEHHIEYGFDESNLDLKYTRNQIRQVLPLLTKDDKQLLITYQNHYEKQQKRREKTVRKIVKTHPETVPLSVYQSLDLGTRLLLLRVMLLKHVEDYEYSFRFFKDLDAKLNQASQFDQPLNEDFLLRLEYGIISIVSSTTHHYQYRYENVTYEKTPYFEVTNQGEVIEGITLTQDDFPITIRSPYPGDMIQMRFGSKKVNRFFIDRKIEKKERKLWPVVENVRKEVIFVAGLGCDVKHYSTKPTIYVVKY